MRKFEEIREEMVGLDEKGGCSTVVDLLLSGQKEEIEALLRKEEGENKEDRA